MEDYNDWIVKLGLNQAEHSQSVAVPVDQPAEQ
jgi:hypothetical protein